MGDTLHLSVKAEYFHQIKSGEKVFEYRSRNEFWAINIFIAMQFYNCLPDLIQENGDVFYPTEKWGYFQCS